VRVQPPGRLAQPAADAIPLDGAGHGRDGEPEPGAFAPVARRLDPDHPGPAHAPPGTHCGEAPTPTEPAPFRQRGPVGVRRFRPFRRRALSTLRPPGVDIRARNPWVLRRYAFLG
jgi:hypothetical protein